MELQDFSAYEGKICSCHPAGIGNVCNFCANRQMENITKMYNEGMQKRVDDYKKSLTKKDSATSLSENKIEALEKSVAALSEVVNKLDWSELKAVRTSSPEPECEVKATLGCYHADGLVHSNATCPIGKECHDYPKKSTEPVIRGTLKVCHRADYCGNKHDVYFVDRVLGEEK